MSDGGETSKGSNNAARGFTAIDLKETQKAFVFIVDVPGVKSSDMNIRVENVVTIRGARMREEPTDDTKYLYLERQVGQFVHMLYLQESADPNNISASVKGGILTVTVPKLPHPEPHKVIDVQGASDSDDDPLIL